jgi:putative protease
MPTSWMEVVIHQHMPMFHMEHCVFCAFMSSGKDYHDCGRPCEKHQVELKDRVGQRHPLVADVGCRNTVYNGRAQTGSEYASRLMDQGARFFRIEFLRESPAEVRAIMEAYQALIEGRKDGTSVWRDLKLVHQLGVTRGTMETRGQSVE